jgi:hypothetical protein
MPASTLVCPRTHSRRRPQATRMPRRRHFPARE